MRAYVPRASEAIIAAFEYQAAARMRSIGERQCVQVIDAARTMSGRRELFIDLVHYSPQGLATISDLILSEMKDASQVPTSAVQ
jgi:hypothetical protein